MKSMTEFMSRMMAECGEQDMDEMQGMMAKFKEGGPEGHTPHMPEKMLRMMVPHCIGMMLPKVAVDKRGEIAASILSTIVAKGSGGMSEEEKRAFISALGEALNASA